MERYTTVQRVEVIKIYYENSCLIRTTFQTHHLIYGQQNRPAELTIRRLVNKFKAAGSVVDQHVPTR